VPLFSHSSHKWGKTIVDLAGTRLAGGCPTTGRSLESAMRRCSIDFGIAKMTPENRPFMHPNTVRLTRKNSASVNDCKAHCVDASIE
jgi:hypothetical protein